MLEFKETFLHKTLTSFFAFKTLIEFELTFRTLLLCTQVEFVFKSENILSGFIEKVKLIDEFFVVEFTGRF